MEDSPSSRDRLRPFSGAPAKLDASFSANDDIGDDEDHCAARADAPSDKNGGRRRRDTQRAARPLLLSPTGSAAEHLRVPVAKEIIVIASLDPYLTLKAAADYSGMGVRTLRAALSDPLHPLPCYRPGGKGGKVLVRRSELDTWMAQFRAVGNADLNAIVNDVLNDLA